MPEEALTVTAVPVAEPRKSRGMAPYKPETLARIESMHRLHTQVESAIAAKAPEAVALLDECMQFLRDVIRNEETDAKGKPKVRLATKIAATKQANAIAQAVLREGANKQQTLKTLEDNGLVNPKACAQQIAQQTIQIGVSVSDVKTREEWEGKLAHLLRSVQNKELPLAEEAHAG